MNDRSSSLRIDPSVPRTLAARRRRRRRRRISRCSYPPIYPVSHRIVQFESVIESSAHDPARHLAPALENTCTEFEGVSSDEYETTTEEVTYPNWVYDWSGSCGC